MKSSPQVRHSHLRHGRNRHMAGCRRVPAAGRRQPAGLHRRDALRLPHHRRSVRRPLELDGREGLQDHRSTSSGHSLHRVSDFKNFDLSFRAVARIDPAKCIKCNLCYVACNDTAHQCIDLIARARTSDGTPSAYDVRSNGKHRGRGHSPAAGGSRRRLRRLPALL